MVGKSLGWDIGGGCGMGGVSTYQSDVFTEGLGAIIP